MSGKIQVETGQEIKQVTKDVISRAITLNENKINYVYWDDSNKLVDRL